MLLARSLIRTLNLKDARAELEALVKLRPDSVAVYDLAALHFSEGQVDKAIALLERAGETIKDARVPALLAILYGEKAETSEEGEIIVGAECDLCGRCTDTFECPALREGPQGAATVINALCTGCGVCLYVCPKGAIKKG